MSFSKNKKKTSPKEIEEAIAFAENASPSDVKVSVTVRLDSDIYMGLKERAKAGEAGGKYQTYLNQILRDHLFGTVPRDEVIESLEEIKERLTKLERKRASNE
jgi:uncharacterized protein (DUF4415 family)